MTTQPRALLIATYEYRDEGLRRLTAPGRDAESLADALRDPEIAGFDVTTLVNEPHYVVGEAIADFYRACGRDDLTLLYFSGHGLKDDDGRLYLATTDTRRDALLFTSLPAAHINDALESCRSRRKVLILDCCYSGAFPAGRAAKADAAVHTLERFQGKGRAVLTASDSTQYSFEGNDISGEGVRSLFTSFLVEGIKTGAADVDQDGDISLDELYDYVHDRVTLEMPQQRPKKQEDVDGKIVIARNVNWTLPSHLAHAIESPIAPQRLSALAGLEHLHRQGNDAVRAAVEQELARLIGDDSRSVSFGAAAALQRLRAAEALTGRPDPPKTPRPEGTPTPTGSARAGDPQPPGVSQDVPPQLPPQPHRQEHRAPGSQSTVGKHHLPEASGPGEPALHKAEGTASVIPSSQGNGELDDRTPRDEALLSSTVKGGTRRGPSATAVVRRLILVSTATVGLAVLMISVFAPLYTYTYQGKTTAWHVTDQRWAVPVVALIAPVPLLSAVLLLLLRRRGRSAAATAGGLMLGTALLWVAIDLEIMSRYIAFGDVLPYKLAIGFWLSWLGVAGLVLGVLVGLWPSGLGEKPNVQKSRWTVFGMVILAASAGLSWRASQAFALGLLEHLLWAFGPAIPLLIGSLALVVLRLSDEQRRVGLTAVVTVAAFQVLVSIRLITIASDKSYGVQSLAATLLGVAAPFATQTLSSRIARRDKKTA
jgi:Caspase domain